MAQQRVRRSYSTGAEQADLTRIRVAWRRPLAVKLKTILKRDVVTLAEGRNLGPPTDVLIDPARHAASLVVLARGRAPESTLFVAAEEVRSFDTDTLAIDSVGSLKIAATDPAALALLARGLDFRGHPLIDGRGRKLGKVVQIRFEEDGRVAEYRVRRGLLGRLKPATKIRPAQLRTSGGEMGVLHEIDAAPPRALTGGEDESASGSRTDELPAGSEPEATRTPEDERSGM